MKNNTTKIIVGLVVVLVVVLAIWFAVGQPPAEEPVVEDPVEDPVAEEPEDEPEEEPVVEEPVVMDMDALRQLAIEGTPRNETLFLNGLQWGPPNNFNLMAGNQAWPTLDNQSGLIYETLFMFNLLTGEKEPLLAESFEWVDDYTLRVVMNPNAMWSDGMPVTAEDVVYTYELGKRYAIGWSHYWDHLTAVRAESPTEVIFELNRENFNRLIILDSLRVLRIMPKHIWTQVEADAGYDLVKIREFFNENPVGSGPYKMLHFDDTRITLVRNENYWGTVVFGGLPAPRFLTHPIFASNDAGNLAFKNGDIDMSQQFIPRVWELWEGGEPFKTYLPEIPYFMPGTMPSIAFNVTKPGLDNPEVRRALAYSINYAVIAEMAMSNYSVPIEPALVLPTEQHLVDMSVIEPQQWSFNVDRANEILDELGAERGADGIRVLPDGTRLGPFEITCPHGWTDWNAALQLVAQNAEEIGIEIRTNFPDQPVWWNSIQTGDFDITMIWNPGPGPAQPWNRARFMMFKDGVAPIGELAFWNFGRFDNPRVNEILREIPTLADEAKLNELYTELNLLFLEYVPFIPLMFRPEDFFTVNEAVWTGFPDEESNAQRVAQGLDPIHPSGTLRGAAIRILYEISAR